MKNLTPTHITVDWYNHDGNAFNEFNLTTQDRSREAADDRYQSLLTSDFLKESPYYYSPFLYKLSGEIHYLAEFASALENGIINPADLQRVATVSRTPHSAAPLTVTLFDYDPETKTWPFREHQTLQF